MDGRRKEGTGTGLDKIWLAALPDLLFFGKGGESLVNEEKMGFGRVLEGLWRKIRNDGIEMGFLHMTCARAFIVSRQACKAGNPRNPHSL